MITKMRTGWLWFDNDAASTLEQKIARAAKRYAAKFGHKADTCYVNPKAVAGNGDVRVDGVVVVAARHILPHHFWLGVQNGRGEEAETMPAVP
jgi:hypothetical protein